MVLNPDSQLGASSLTGDRSQDNVASGPYYNDVKYVLPGLTMHLLILLAVG